MLKNYFKIAWRNLKRNKSYAFINVLGLSLGMACGILIFTLVTYHLSFDTFHKDKNRIYRITTEFHDETITSVAAVPAPIGKALKDEYGFFDNIVNYVGFNNILISLPDDNKGVKKFEEENGVVFTDPSFFDVFNFPLVSGDKKTALTSPNSTVITEKLAKKYFGTIDNASGKVIKMDNQTSYVVKGVLANLPPNSDFDTEIFLSYDNLKDKNPWMAGDSSWPLIYGRSQCYFLAKPGITAAQINAQLGGISRKYYNAKDANVFRFKVQPLSDIHFNTNLNGNMNKKYLWALSFIGIFLIVTACVNFVNLATAQALNRAKEVGIRKVLGSLRGQLFWQFIVETALITFFAIIIACGLAYMALPVLNKLFKIEMALDLFKNIRLLSFILITGVAVVFFSGSYPGLVLSKFRPVEALKSKLSQRNIGGFSLRRVLVVTQFTISQILIIGTIVIAYQMNYSNNTSLGFDKEAVVILPIPVGDKVKMNTFKTRASELRGVNKMSMCYQAPAASSNRTTSLYYDNKAEAERWPVNQKDADAEYLNTFGLKLVAGRNFFPSDTVREYVVNEMVAKKLGLTPQQLIGKTISINDKTDTHTVVGVVSDFYNYSFREEAAPIVIQSDYTNYSNCAVKVDMKNIKTLLPQLENIWNETYPDYLYKYNFLDDRIAKFYEGDVMMLKMVETFAGIAVLIGCLGLYGLVSFMAVRKTKEIGVRKVLGANMSSILWLFGREFTRLLVIAFVIAAPIAWWAMHRYLEDFKYRITIGPGIFLIAIGCTFLIAAITVAYKSIGAALTNPVKSLRSE
ncbi:ABC transporter permease [Chitinophagaceae bacterium LWZ2-11]